MAQLLCDAKDAIGIPLPDESYDKFWKLANEPDEIKLNDIFRVFDAWCKVNQKPLVLIIDEVDSAANNQVFLDFLAKIRAGYIKRERKREYRTFQSVILAGVTDVKHLKRKIRKDADAKENSPWNIAADFTIDMSLSVDGIRGMLDEYEADHHTGMDTMEIARMIRYYTNYPFLVSRICQLIDERMVPKTFGSLSEAWTDDGVLESVKVIVMEKNTLFDSLMGKLNDYDRLRGQLERILFRGDTIEYLPDNREQDELMMYGFIVNDHGKVAISNRIFEMRLYRYYIGESEFAEELKGDALDNKPAFTKGGKLNIPLIMERFIETQRHIRNLNDAESEKVFIEEEGREKFLTCLSPMKDIAGIYIISRSERIESYADYSIRMAL